MPKYTSQAVAQASVTPRPIALLSQWRSCSRISSNTKIASGAAAARLWWPMPRVTSTGDQPKAAPASHEIQGSPLQNLRASRNIAYAEKTVIARYTRLNVATIPSGRTNGSAIRLANAV